jgi:hypothetical protein
MRQSAGIETIQKHMRRYSKTAIQAETLPCTVTSIH